MGEEEIGQSLKTEFDEEDQEAPSGDSTSGAAASSSSMDSRSEPTRTFPTGQERGAAKPAVSPFGGAAKAPSGPANPFGSGSSRQPFIEPSSMSPNMQPRPLDTEPWWKKITLVQVVITLSFTLIISLMLGTFAVVLRSGAIRFND